MTVVLVVLAVPAAGLLALALLLILDRRADRAEWRRLRRLQPERPERFSDGMIADLPAPARRYFRHAILPGAPLLPVAEIEMRGRFGLGDKSDPKHQPMEARQILAAPDGFVWAMRTRGGLPVSGSDSARWTRFRIFGLIPVARRGGDRDHARAAFGRCVAEAAFWTPAALLPGPGVTWEAVDADTARVTVRRGDLEQAVDIALDSQGMPVTVSFLRWTDANPQGIYRLQPFGGFPSDFREVEGYRLPFRVEAGNMFGTEDYFPFFLVDVAKVAFPREGA